MRRTSPCWRTVHHSIREWRRGRLPPGRNQPPQETRGGRGSPNPRPFGMVPTQAPTPPTCWRAGPSLGRKGKRQCSTVQCSARQGGNQMFHSDPPPEARPGTACQAWVWLEPKILQKDSMSSVPIYQQHQSIKSDVNPLRKDKNNFKKNPQNPRGLNTIARDPRLPGFSREPILSHSFLSNPFVQKKCFLAGWVGGIFLPLLVGG